MKGSSHFLLPEVIDHQVMCNAHQPGTETTALGIPPLPDGGDGLAEGLLKEIIRKIFVSYGVEDN